MFIMIYFSVPTECPYGMEHVSVPNIKAHPSNPNTPVIADAVPEESSGGIVDITNNNDKRPHILDPVPLQKTVREYLVILIYSYVIIHM